MLSYATPFSSRLARLQDREARIEATRRQTRRNSIEAVQARIDKARAEMEQSRRDTAHLSASWPVACEEAAHAILDHCLGIPFSVVSLDPQTNSGAVKVSNWDRQPPERILIATIAGPAARARVEYGDARQYVVRGNDAGIVESALARVPAERRQAVRQTAARKAIEFIDGVWCAVDYTARELVCRGYLFDSHIAEICGT